MSLRRTTARTRSVFALATLAIIATLLSTANSAGAILNSTTENVQWNAIMRVRSGGGHCTGAVVGTNFIMTAAHCVVGDDMNDIFIHRPNGTDEGQRLSISVVDVHQAPGYSQVVQGGERVSWNFPNDIALLELSRNLSPTEATLLGIAEARPSRGLTLVGYGWGGDGSRVWPNEGPHRTLRSASFSVGDPTGCSGDLCLTGQNSASVCSGDSGGPLVRYSPAQGRSVVFGVIGGGTILPNDCGVGGEDSDVVAAQVADHRAWIIETIAGAATCFDHAPTVIMALGERPTESSDVIMGTSTVDQIDGLGGNDLICAGDGLDIVDGGLGNDRIDGGPGLDRLRGASGNDTIYGGDGPDFLYGGPGDDELFGGLDGDTLNGDEGMDRLSGGPSEDLLKGGDGDDVLFGDAANDRLFGDYGRDIIYGGTGDDELFGQADNDTLYGEDGDDQLDGYTGNDGLFGGPGNDVLIGNRGHKDVLNGGNGNDQLDGGNGKRDRCVGGRGTDSGVGCETSKTIES